MRSTGGVLANHCMETLCAGARLRLRNTNDTICHLDVSTAKCGYTAKLVVDCVLTSIPVCNCQKSLYHVTLCSTNNAATTCSRCSRQQSNDFRLSCPLDIDSRKGWYACLYLASVGCSMMFLRTLDSTSAAALRWGSDDSIL